MKNFEEEFISNQNKLEKNINEMIDRFNLKNLTEEELCNLNSALSNVFYEKRKSLKDEKVKELKEKYEGKYFTSKEIGLIYIEEILDEYKFKGWQFSMFDPDEILELKQQQKYVFKNGIINDILSDTLSMLGNATDTALIKDAKELSRKEAEEFIEKIFKQIKEDYFKQSTQV